MAAHTKNRNRTITPSEQFKSNICQSHLLLKECILYGTPNPTKLLILQKKKILDTSESLAWQSYPSMPWACLDRTFSRSLSRYKWFWAKIISSLTLRAHASQLKSPRQEHNLQWRAVLLTRGKNQTGLVKSVEEEGGDFVGSKDWLLFLVLNLH